MKSELKQKAISLREKGYSYSEILKIVPVAKSSLSLWLRSVGLSKRQKQRLTEKKLISMKKGWEARRNQRLKNICLIKNKAIKKIKKINNYNLWLMGIMLYWSEGSKEKNYKPGQGVIFSNSDPLMIKVFLKWLKMIKILEDRITFGIYIHETSKNRIKNIQTYWASICNISRSKFGKIYFKKHKILSKRKNIGEKYYGLLRIRIKKSSILNRQIAGWIEGICAKCGVV